MSAGLSRVAKIPASGTDLTPTNLLIMRSLHALWLTTSFLALGLANCGSPGATAPDQSDVCAQECAAGEVCSSGACVCAAGRTECSGLCVDVASSAENCGACGTVCPGSDVCSRGLCQSACAIGETACGRDCVTVDGDVLNCGACGQVCEGNSVCSAGVCTPLGAGGTGGGDGGTSGGAASGGSASGGAASGGTGAGGSDPGACDPGSTTTEWASGCPTAPYRTCTAGSWVAPGRSTGTVEQGMTLRYETTHFAFFWKDGTTITMQQAENAGVMLESIWNTYFGAPMYMPEPFCGQTTKYKAGIHIDNTYPLYGGAYSANGVNRIPGMWVGPGAASDRWGLGHEFMHGVQSHWGGLAQSGGGQQSNYIGWIYESHANFGPHQLAEYDGDVHCSEMLVNAPHIYLGSTRNRYCNWQFMEYLKDKECYRAVNDIWAPASGTSNDPFSAIMASRGWTVSEMNDFIGEYAMHNVTWDYKESAGAFRSTYGPLTDTSRPERRNRITRLEPLGSDWATTKRFVSPYYGAPQRWGYNVSEIVPEAGSTEVRVTFRGLSQTGADADFRWGIVATNATLTEARYSEMVKGIDGSLSFCLSPGERLWLVVTATPSVQKHIHWDQPYASIHRYPYMIELDGGWPAGFEGGALGACPPGTERHENGGGCAPASLAGSVYVGPYARVLGGTVSGSARIEDQATVLNGATVSGGTVGGLTVLSRFNVSGSAEVRTTFYPPGFFEAGQGLSGTAKLLGDVEYRGASLNRSSGSFSGFVDNSTATMTLNEVTTPPPYAWRP